MGIITAAVIGSICKELAKLLVNAATDSKAASAIAGELASAAGKSLAERVIPRLVAAYVGPVEEHPEFRGMTEQDREAVRLEVIESIRPALDRTFLRQPPYKVNEVVDRLVRARGHRGTPVGFSADCVSMYQQALDASVRTIIKVAESTTERHAANAAEIHAKLDRLADTLDAAANAWSQVLTVLDFVKKSVADLNAKEFNERRDFLEVYYRTICKTLDHMELYGLDVQEGNPARSQRLSVAYISLNLTTKGEESDQGSRSWESILDTLEPGAKGRLLVRGDAGMGKTTLLRWAAISIAAQDHKIREGRLGVRGSRLETEDVGRLVHTFFRNGREYCYDEMWRGKVPLLVILRECPDGKFPDLDELPKFVSHAVGTPPAGFIRWLLDNGKSLVMIDGLDEVPTGEPTRQTSRAISDLMAAYGDRGNLFIATSRPLVKDPPWIAQLNFREAVIAPMTDPERDALIHKWHAAVAEQTNDDKRRAEIEAMPADLIHQLNTRPAIARLATVPLLCAMICAQSGPLGSKLPESEFAIINKLAEAMLWVRDRDRSVPKTGTPWDDLMEDKRLAVAARLAHFLIAQGKAAVPRGDALKKIADALRFAGRTEAEAHRDAPSILIRMGDRGGVIRAPEDGLVEFAHKTFCEFLSAFQFVEDQDTRFLGDHAPEPGPSNVCRFTAGVKNRKYTEELIGRVLDGEDSPEERGVVALRMKFAAPTLDPTVQERVKQIENRLIPPTSPTAAKAIADLGDEVVGRLAFEPGMKVEQQILNASALSQMRSQKAAVALRGYAATAENLTLVEILCRTVNPLTIPLVRRALTEPDNRLRPGLNDPIRSQITDAVIETWLRIDPGLKALNTLNLSCTQVTDAGVKELARPDSGLNALTTLNLGRTQVTDAGVKELARPDSGFNALTTLDLSHTQVTDKGVKELARPDSGLKEVEILFLCGLQVSEDSMRALADCNSGLRALSSLELDRSQIGDGGIAELASKSSGLRNLKKLYLAHTGITSLGVKKLAAADSGLKSLESLYLWFTTLGDDACEILADKEAGLVALTSLNLSYTQVTDAGVAAIKARFPKIDISR